MNISKDAKFIWLKKLVKQNFVVGEVNATSKKQSIWRFTF